VLDYDPKDPEKTRLFFTYNGFIAWCTASKNHYADLLRKYCTRITSDIHRGDGGQYIAKIVERELAARGINPNFQPVLPALAAFEKLEGEIEKLNAVHTELASVKSDYQSLAVKVDKLIELIPTLALPPPPLSPPPPPTPSPKPLSIHEVLMHMGYLSGGGICQNVGAIAYALYVEKYGKEPPVIQRGGGQDFESYKCRAYYECDRPLLERAVEMTPDKIERPVCVFSHTFGNKRC
jgi:hypothetical protein